jgi:hypothetical protein
MIVGTIEFQHNVVKVCIGVLVEWSALSLELLNSNMILTLFCLGVLTPTKVQHMSKSILLDML